MNSTENSISGNVPSGVFPESPCAMLLIHLEGGGIARANTAASDLYGYSQEELTGRSLFDLEAGSSTLVSDMLQEAVSLRRHVFRSSHKLAGGCVQEVDCHCIPVRFSDGDFLLLTVHPADDDGEGPGGCDIEEELQRQTSIQELLMRMSSTYIDIPPENLEDEIVRSLGEMGSMVGADRGYLFFYDFAGDTCTNTHEWCAEGIESQIGNLQDVSIKNIPWWVNANKRGEPVYIADVQALEPSDHARIFLEPQNIKSLIAVPLMRGEECLGFVGFDSVRRRHRYTDTETRLLFVFARMLVSVLNRRKMEKDLAAGEETFRSIIENSPMAIFLLRLHEEGRLILEDSNPAASRILGVDVDELLGLTLEEAFPPLAETEVPLRYRRAAEFGETWHGETIPYSYGKVSGTYEVYAFQISPARCAVILDDITERIDAEARIEHTNRMLKDVIETIPSRVFWKDLQGRFLGCNGLFAGDAGLPDPDSLVGKTDHDMVWRSEAEKYRADDKEVTDSGKPKLYYEEEQTTPSGSRRLLRTSKIPLRNADGEIYGMFGAYEDITEGKKAEREHRNLQEQLGQVQKMESVGRLAGGLAHDYNNMLGVILGYVELAVLKAGEDSPILSDLEEIRKAARRSANLTRQILAFARRQAAKPRVLVLNDTLAGMLSMMRRLIGENITLEWLPGEDAGRVRMDASQLDQILANLVVNSRDAIDGNGTITIETRGIVLTEDDCAERPQAFPGEFGVLSVTDDGCGMDSSTLGMLFEPFFTTKEPGRGTGLGLSTVYGIVRQNGGFITVKSTPGSGSCFSIHIPKHSGEDAVSPDPAVSVAISGGSGTILLVEDEPSILNITQLMLRRAGFAVMAASTPAEAIASGMDGLEKTDLLLTDVIMPGMNGQELVSKLREVKPGLKCLFMSGYTADVIARHGVLEEGVHFIQKPFSYDQLITAVRMALNQ